MQSDILRTLSEKFYVKKKVWKNEHSSQFPTHLKYSEMKKLYTFKKEMSHHDISQFYT